MSATTFWASYRKGATRVFAITAIKQIHLYPTVAALGKKFNSGNRTMAAQDFCHATQALLKTVSDYILCLEKIFRQAYGQDAMGTETRNMLSFS